MTYRRKLLIIPFTALLFITPIVSAEAPTIPVHYADSDFQPYSLPDPSIPIIIDFVDRPEPTKPIIKVPKPKVVVQVKQKPVLTTGFHLDKNVSWYGPGFYLKRTACGLKFTKTILGVAHRTLPCGTLVTFRNPKNGRTATVPVIDRGPYVAGRQWDLSGGLCVKLDHCYTGPIQYKVKK